MALRFNLDNAEVMGTWDKYETLCLNHYRYWARSILLAVRTLRTLSTLTSALGNLSWLITRPCLKSKEHKRSTRPNRQGLLFYFGSNIMGEGFWRCSILPSPIFSPCIKYIELDLFLSHLSSCRCLQMTRLDLSFSCTRFPSRTHAHPHARGRTQTHSQQIFSVTHTSSHVSRLFFPP